MISVYDIQKGDCIKLMKALSNNSVDMVLCDLPFRKKRKWEYDVPLAPLWEQYHRIVKPNGAIVLFAPEPKTLEQQLLLSNADNYRYFHKWKENGKSEVNLFVFYREKPTINVCKPVSHHDRYSTELMQMAMHNGSKPFYAYQRPISLLDYLIRKYTQPNDCVMDNCMGTGSTGIACIKSGRRFIGMEFDQYYFGVSEKRLAEARAKYGR